MHKPRQHQQATAIASFFATVIILGSTLLTGPILVGSLVLPSSHQRMLLSRSSRKIAMASNNIEEEMVPANLLKSSFSLESSEEEKETSRSIIDDVDETTTTLPGQRMRMLVSQEDTNMGGMEPPKPKRRKKYRRKKEKPRTETERESLRQDREKEYEQFRTNDDNQVPGSASSIWGFDSLFPTPIWDAEEVQKELYGKAERDEQVTGNRNNNNNSKSNKTTRQLTREITKMRSSRPSPGSSIMKMYQKEPKLGSDDLSSGRREVAPPRNIPKEEEEPCSPAVKAEFKPNQEVTFTNNDDNANLVMKNSDDVLQRTDSNSTTAQSLPLPPVINKKLTRKVEESVYGYRRTTAGDYYDTSLNREGAVKFREGKRIGNALNVNADRLTYFAKKELRKGRVEEAQDLYEQALAISPRDGRAYLGLSKVAERRRDFKRARECLQAGIYNSISIPDDSNEDAGANPFLLQALGCLEEKRGHPAVAEELFIAAVQSRPAHAAAWVSLAQLRTGILKQGAAAGRVCYQTAERELKRAGKPPSSYVYTAWAALEYKRAGNTNYARNLFGEALKCDPKCSAAWLQLGLLEANREDWDKAQECFETVLKFDQRNSRVLQAYAIMETKRPEGRSRKAIGLFERALKVNSRDAGVLQPYGLYCADLGDIASARELLQRATKVQKRHAPAWQAWGVLETRHGQAKAARDIFQQGIWACAQLGGGQSGGYKCARLWQAWGVLEAREGDYAAARRCFNRALDSDNRNVATITAWTLMEQDLGNYEDARRIFERALKQFPSSSNEKLALWRSYEVFEQQSGDMNAAQEVYRRSMGESFELQDNLVLNSVEIDDDVEPLPPMTEVLKRSKDFETLLWGDEGSMRGEVWLNDGSIEGKVPASIMKKGGKKQ